MFPKYIHVITISLNPFFSTRGISTIGPEVSISKPEVISTDIIQPTRTSTRDSNSAMTDVATGTQSLPSTDTVLILETTMSPIQNTTLNNSTSTNLDTQSSVSPTLVVTSPWATTTSSSATMTSLNISPTAVTSAITFSTTRTQQQVVSLDAIRREIVRQLGHEVQNGMKRLFAVPKVADHTVSPVTQRSFPTVQLRPDVPNTQVVSVSNILDRFYPNYIAPFFFSLTQKRRSGLKLPVACDVMSDEFRCKARGIYNQSPGISNWCEINCRARNCVTFMCECSCEDRQSQNSSCHAIAEFHGVEGMDQWCIANCKVGYCPANTCSVEDCVNKSTNGEA